jgi:hypothetical protein
MVWAARALLTLPLLVSVLSIRLGVSVRTLARIWAAPATASVLMLLSLRWLAQSPLADHGALGLPELIATGAAVYGVALLALSWRSTRGKLLLGSYRR